MRANEAGSGRSGDDRPRGPIRSLQAVAPPTKLDLPSAKIEHHRLLQFMLAALVPVGALAILAAREGRIALAGDFEVSLTSLIVLTLCVVALLFIGHIHRWGLKLRSLAAVIEIDQTIHLAGDSHGIATTLLSRIGEICGCDAVLVALVKNGSPPVLQTFLARDGEIERPVVETGFFAPDEALQIENEPDHFTVGLEAGVPSYLERLAGAGVRNSLVFPLFARGELAGVIALGDLDSGGDDPEGHVLVRHMANQVGLALGSSRTVQEKYRLEHYDRLTGLPNRHMYRDRLVHALHRARRLGRPMATCLLDLDDFKRVNDTMGHAAGDLLLVDAAERLVNCVRLTDAVARSDSDTSSAAISRFGGDEFTVLLTEIADARDASRVAQRILDAFREPFTVNGQELVVTLSMGIAVHPSDGEDAEELLKNADTAMFCAKKRGRDTFQFYARSMNAEASRRLHLETRLRRALERDEFTLHYQPLRDAMGGQLTGVEALVRWNDPDMGLVSPVEFIPIAEETGFICDLGEWVLLAACRQVQRWRNQGYRTIRLAVNLSPHQLRRPGLAHAVEQTLTATEMSADQLELELTESAIMQDDEVTETTIGELNEMGIGLALDDFGTGYSSLSYLRRFPLQRLKIDRSFVQRITTHPGDAALTAGIIGLAHTLCLKVVAEGVESQAQAEFLRGQCCDELQGFLFSRPIPGDAFTRFLDVEKPDDQN